MAAEETEWIGPFWSQHSHWQKRRLARFAAPGAEMLLVHSEAFQTLHPTILSLSSGGSSWVVSENN